MTGIFIFLTVLAICFTVLVWKMLDLLADGVNVFTILKKKDKKNKKTERHEIPGK